MSHKRRRGTTTSPATTFTGSPNSTWRESPRELITKKIRACFFSSSESQVNSRTSTRPFLVVKKKRLRSFLCTIQGPTGVGDLSRPSPMARPELAPLHSGSPERNSIEKDSAVNFATCHPLRKEKNNQGQKQSVEDSAVRPRVLDRDLNCCRRRTSKNLQTFCRLKTHVEKRRNEIS